MKAKELFFEFEPTKDKTQWMEAVTKDLKGKPYEKIWWNTYDGFSFEPYYKLGESENIATLNTLPGAFPFLRGNKEVSEKNNWLVREDYANSDSKEVAELMKESLKRGVQSVGFKFSNDLRSGKINDGTKSGIVINKKEDLENLLDALDLTKTPVNLMSGVSSSYIFETFLNVLKSKKIDLSQVKGSIDNAPLEDLLLNGKFAFSEEKTMNNMLEIFKAVKNELPNFKAVTISSHHYHNAGASVAQEIACTLAEAVAYLDLLTENFSIDEITPHLQFSLSTGKSYFMEIAKLRAFRYLWSQVVEAYNPKSENTAKVDIHAKTSFSNLAVYDTHVNMLRTTTEAMSAAIGGCNSMTVSPFDEPIGEADSFSLRIARNTQIILKEEAHFDKVVDPAAGSYYIEKLTVTIIDEAWKIFKDIEAAGGLKEAAKSGSIQKMIADVRAKRMKNVAFNRDNFVGVNHVPIPNSLDPKLKKESKEQLKQNADIIENLGCYLEKAEFEVEPLVKYRETEVFEKLREVTDKFSEKTGKRPVAFMATLGNLAMRKARAGFSMSFLGIAGFDVIDNNGFKDVDDAVKNAIASKAEIVTICSSDDEYADFAADLTRKLKSENPDVFVILAGYPKDIVDDLKEAGVDEFIHARVNALECLTGIQGKLGIL